MSDRTERVMALLRERGPMLLADIVAELTTWWPGEKRRILLALEVLVAEREVRVLQTPRGPVYEVVPEPAVSEVASPALVASLFGRDP